MSPAILLKQFYFTCRIYSSYYIYVVTRLLQCQKTASIPGGRGYMVVVKLTYLVT